MTGQIQKNDNPSSPSTLMSISNTSFENHNNRNSIHNCDSSRDILSIFKGHKERLSIDAPTFGKAMGKCNKLKEYSITIKLMNILLNESKIKLSIGNHQKYNQLLITLILWPTNAKQGLLFKDCGLKAVYDLTSLTFKITKKNKNLLIYPKNL